MGQRPWRQTPNINGYNEKSPEALSHRWVDFGPFVQCWWRDAHYQRVAQQICPFLARFLTATAASRTTEMLRRSYQGVAKNKLPLTIKKSRPKAHQQFTTKLLAGSMGQFQFFSASGDAGRQTVRGHSVQEPSKARKNNHHDICCYYIYIYDVGISI